MVSTTNITTELSALVDDHAGTTIDSPIKHCLSAAVAHSVEATKSGRSWHKRRRDARHFNFVKRTQSAPAKNRPASTIAVAAAEMQVTAVDDEAAAPHVDAENSKKERRSSTSQPPAESVATTGDVLRRHGESEIVEVNVPIASVVCETTTVEANATIAVKKPRDKLKQPETTLDEAAHDETSRDATERDELKQAEKQPAGLTSDQTKIVEKKRKKKASNETKRDETMLKSIELVEMPLYDEPIEMTPEETAGVKTTLNEVPRDEDELNKMMSEEKKAHDEEQLNEPTFDERQRGETSLDKQSDQIKTGAKRRVKPKRRETPLDDQSQRGDQQAAEAMLDNAEVNEATLEVQPIDEEPPGSTSYKRLKPPEMLDDIKTEKINVDEASNEQIAPIETRRDKTKRENKKQKVTKRDETPPPRIDQHDNEQAAERKLGSAELDEMPLEVEQNDGEKPESASLEQMTLINTMLDKNKFDETSNNPTMLEEKQPDETTRENEKQKKEKKREKTKPAEDTTVATSLTKTRSQLDTMQTLIEQATLQVASHVVALKRLPTRVDESQVEAAVEQTIASVDVSDDATIALAESPLGLKANARAARSEVTGSVKLNKFDTVDTTSGIWPDEGANEGSLNATRRLAIRSPIFFANANDTDATHAELGKSQVEEPQPLKTEVAANLSETPSVMSDDRRRAKRRRRQTTKVDIATLSGKQEDDLAAEIAEPTADGDAAGSQSRQSLMSTTAESGDIEASIVVVDDDEAAEGRRPTTSTEGTKSPPAISRPAIVSDSNVREDEAAANDTNVAAASSALIESTNAKAAEKRTPKKQKAPRKPSPPSPNLEQSDEKAPIPLDAQKDANALADAIATTIVANAEPMMLGEKLSQLEASDLQPASDIVSVVQLETALARSSQLVGVTTAKTFDANIAEERCEANIERQAMSIGPQNDALAIEKIPDAQIFDASAEVVETLNSIEDAAIDGGKRDEEKPSDEIEVDVLRQPTVRVEQSYKDDRPSATSEETHLKTLPKLPTSSSGKEAEPPTATEQSPTSPVKNMRQEEAVEIVDGASLVLIDEPAKTPTECEASQAPMTRGAQHEATTSDTLERSQHATRANDDDKSEESKPAQFDEPLTQRHFEAMIQNDAANEARSCEYAHSSAAPAETASQRVRLTASKSTSDQIADDSQRVEIADEQTNLKSKRSLQSPSTSSEHAIVQLELSAPNDGDGDDDQSDCRRSSATNNNFNFRRFTRLDRAHDQRCGIVGAGDRQRFGKRVASLRGAVQSARRSGAASN